MLFPFCLDGDVSPKKLDPFGAGYKDMKWNLVGCTGHDKRVGYVWLEFERLDERGAAQRLTAGIGMRGHQQQSEVARWFFIARNRAVGEDLALLNGRNPRQQGGARRRARRRRRGNGQPARLPGSA